MFFGFFIVASSLGLVSYARRSPELLRTLTINRTSRIAQRADFGRQGPLTEKEAMKRRVDTSDDFF